MSRLDAYLPPAPPADPVRPDPDIDPALFLPPEPAPWQCRTLGSKHADAKG